MKKTKVANRDFLQKRRFEYKSEAGGTNHPLVISSVLFPKPVNNSQHSTQIVLVHIFEAIHYLLCQQRIFVLGVLIEALKVSTTFEPDTALVKSIYTLQVCCKCFDGVHIMLDNTLIMCYTANKHFVSGG